MGKKLRHNNVDIAQHNGQEDHQIDCESLHQLRYNFYNSSMLIFLIDTKIVKLPKHMMNNIDNLITTSAFVLEHVPLVFSSFAYPFINEVL